MVNIIGAYQKPPESRIKIKAKGLYRFPVQVVQRSPIPNIVICQAFRKMKEQAAIAFHQKSVINKNA
jgi:hypothetical protein